MKVDVAGTTIVDYPIEKQKCEYGQELEIVKKYY